MAAEGARCEICQVEVSKYKCPKCQIRYCSLKCFKSEAHSHENLPEAARPEAPAVLTAKPPEITSGFDKLLKDKKLLYMLQFASLKTHLSTILAIMSDAAIANEPTAEGRREIANKKLCDLRVGGPEENSLVEEFCSRVIELMEH
ncbi:hypothetical protein BABINDRAFT_169013 [Babjeviella inositovora NRRL Y-12698]|uniref:HIT-type domain-containing protein n=1 Tax=Babjeviella inositovora NRRL Y-12698 TaxID=984486 RepID=A0A1E3QJ31_9ASCO|nr:uncharacterized protein BABINDRAFT_169013 [Babjeviella inositovora NRRL Y-12698]ODQ77705.1 hypothetical protein BABINDRAFT_169013 [Babjeviella inositovora NRRL Y-12698]